MKLMSQKLENFLDKGFRDTLFSRVHMWLVSLHECMRVPFIALLLAKSYTNEAVLKTCFLLIVRKEILRWVNSTLLGLLLHRIIFFNTLSNSCHYFFIFVFLFHTKIIFPKFTYKCNTRVSGSLSR